MHCYKGRSKGRSQVCDGRDSFHSGRSTGTESQRLISTETFDKGFELIFNYGPIVSNA